MAQKRYQLTSAASAAGFVKGGKIKYRIRHERGAGPKKVRSHPKFCPDVEIPVGAVVGTANEVAQRSIECAQIPKFHGGPGAMWQDVTSVTSPASVGVNLDTTFALPTVARRNRRS